MSNTVRLCKESLAKSMVSRFWLKIRSNVVHALKGKNKGKLLPVLPELDVGLYYFFRSLFLNPAPSFSAGGITPVLLLKRL